MKCSANLLTNIYHFKLQKKVGTDPVYMHTYSYMHTPIFDNKTSWRLLLRCRFNSWQGRNGVSLAC
jgi:hypothetical protein